VRKLPGRAPAYYCLVSGLGAAVGRAGPFRFVVYPTGGLAGPQGWAYPHDITDSLLVTGYSPTPCIDPDVPPSVSTSPHPLRLWSLSSVDGIPGQDELSRSFPKIRKGVAVSC